MVRDLADELAVVGIDDLAQRSERDPQLLEADGLVGRNWAGHTLIDLDLRGQVNVQVLEWRRDDQLLEIDPKRPLREGDVLALAGGRDGLLAARWIS